MTRLAGFLFVWSLGAAFATGCGREPASPQPRFEPSARPPAAVEPAQTQELTPRPVLAESTLAVGGRIVKAASGTETWIYRRRFGAIDVSVRDDAIVASDANGCKRWELAMKERVVLLGSDDSTLYVASVSRAAVVRRLNLKDGTWLNSLTVPAAERKEKTTEMVVAVLPSPDGLICLSGRVTDDKTRQDDGQLLTYRVSFFATGKSESAWSLEFPSAGSRESPGAFLLSEGGPQQVVDFPTPLILLGKTVIVCSGSQQDLVCLDRATGKVEWRLARLWEYRRGFVGPSVWNHFLGRYGMSDSDIEFAERGAKAGGFIDPEFRKHLQETLAKAVARAAERRGSIVAGPVVVRGEDGAVSLFVVVAVSESARWSNYLADARIYEITDRGEPVGIANLPRMVRTEAHVDRDATVWGCSGGGLVRVGVNGTRSKLGGMFGGQDMLCRIEWYREAGASKVEAWLSTGAAGETGAFTRTYAYSPCGGGYVLKQGDRVYHFPIQRVDLKNGNVEYLVLDVPCDRAIPPPATNYSKTTRGIEASGPHPLGVTWLQVVDDSLEVVLGMQGNAASVRFALRDVEK